MLIDNVRTGQIKNPNNVLLLIVGLGVLVLGPRLGMDGFHLPALSAWPLVALVPFGLWVKGWLGGGAAKFLIALLPWFSPGEYVWVAVGGLVACSVIAKALRQKDTRLVPPAVAIGLMVQAAGIAVLVR
jgi:Flp pilus assembly protein protease CpaA